MNKDRLKSFEGTIAEIQKAYNEWSESHDNIEILDSIYLPIRERLTGTTTKDYVHDEHTDETLVTDYILSVRYMETEKEHIERVNKGAGSGVS